MRSANVPFMAQSAKNFVATRPARGDGIRRK